MTRLGPRRGVLARTPLRVKLVAALLALVGLALIATGFATSAALSGYLNNEVDSQLRSAVGPVAGALARGDFGQNGHAGGPLSTYFVQVTAADGSTFRLQPQLGGDASAPRLPALTVPEAARRSGTPYTVPAQHGDGQWRALTTVLGDGSGSITIATSLRDVHATVTRLDAIDAVVSLLVLVVFGGLGYAVVRYSLRPLGDVERTAQAIAAGDLSRRVPDRDPRTEVGRLSASLNGMLSQIESAFRAREASEAAARGSEERMRQFVADASHELRTPLTSIRGFAELYRLGAQRAVPDPADVNRTMRRIEDEAGRMGLLVEDLLLLARLDQQRPLERSPVDLLTIATEAVQDARLLAPGRRIELQLIGTEPAPVVLGDEARLRQVLGNLVGNALTHTPTGADVAVRVGAVTETPPDGGGTTRWGVLEVADSGPGLCPEDAARVFERFYRADSSRARTHGGTGLGLSIVAALVAAHGGAVTLDTAPGRGATFRVRLPLALDDHHDGEPGAEQPPAAASDRVRTR
jgi:two-component system OmpR family sensor kinase